MNKENFVRVYNTATLKEDLERDLEYWKAWKRRVRVVQIVPIGFLRRKTVVLFEWIEKGQRDGDL